jgi:hypothetical protein
VPPARVIPKASPPIESQPIVASPPVGEVQPAEPTTTINPPDNAAPPPPVPTPTTTPPPVAIERPAQPAPAEPLPTPLQTTANPSAAEQRTRATLEAAKKDLARIDTRTFSADARAQYDLARRYVEQANDALTEKKFEFAQQLADKAATLAALLQRR